MGPPRNRPTPKTVGVYVSQAFDQLKLRMSSSSEVYKHYDTKRKKHRPALRWALSTRELRPIRETKFAQDQSLFFTKLPPEIRLRVYELYMENLEIIFETVKKPGRQDSGSYQTAQFASYYNEGMEYREETKVAYGEQGARKGLLDLPLSCRRIYMESINLLYSQHTWIFRDPSEFVEFQKRILPQRFEALTSLSLKFSPCRPQPHLHRSNRWPYSSRGPTGFMKDWEAMFKAISKLPRLRFLEIIMTPLAKSPAWESCIVDMLPLLWTVENAKTYEVFINWAPLAQYSHTTSEILDRKRTSFAPFHLIEEEKVYVDGETYPPGGTRAIFPGCWCMYCVAGDGRRQHFRIGRRQSETEEWEFTSSWAFAESHCTA